VIEEPLQHVIETNGLLNEVSKGTDRTEDSVQAANKKLSTKRKTEVDQTNITSNGSMSWSIYEEQMESEHHGN